LFASIHGFGEINGKMFYPGSGSDYSLVNREFKY